MVLDGFWMVLAFWGVKKGLSFSKGKKTGRKKLLLDLAGSISVSVLFVF